MSNFFEQPDNGADKVITLRISGNRLVSILNTLDSLMHETGRYRLCGNDVVGQSRSCDDLYRLTEAIRDELSAQRNGTTSENIRASMRKFA